MTDKDIQRINELYKKSKSPEGLTPEEKIEQAELRGAFLEAVRKHLHGPRDTIKIQKEDGRVVDVMIRHQEKYGN